MEDANLILVLRATGNGYQVHELDLTTSTFTATWPAWQFGQPGTDTPRTRGRELARPSELKGDARRAYRAAFKAWNGRAFNFDVPAPAVEPNLILRQASRLGGFKAPWVAKITGSCPTYRFTREFLDPIEREHGGVWSYRLEDGLVEICDRNSKGAERRWFARVSGGVVTEVEAALVAKAFPELPKSEGPVDPIDNGTYVECLECGARYPLRQGHLVDAGGMGCARCNH